MAGNSGFSAASMMFCVTALTVIFNSGGLSTHVGDSLSLGASLFANQTIISKNGTFELGFFSPSGSKNSYVGIWYTNNIPEQIIVWVANRETPAKNNPGVLKLSHGGNLGLFDAEGTSLWSVHISSKGSRAVLLDSGNFVLLSNDSQSEPVWQSFDYPGDTWLPGMWLGGQQKLIAWKSSMDPAPGLFSLWPDLSAPIRQAILLWNNSVKYWESGPWDAKNKIFTGIPEMLEGLRYSIKVKFDSSGLVHVSFNLPNGIFRFLRVKLGQIQVYAVRDDDRWSNTAARPTDQCAVYGFCGAYGSCNSNNIQFCTCFEGFHPADEQAWNSQNWWASGCVRERPLNCDTRNGSTDVFIETGVSLPDDSASSYPALTQEDCKKACLRNCSCTAFAFMSPSAPCKIWSGDLLDLKSSSSNNKSTISIRVGAAPSSPNYHKSSSSILRTIIIIVSVLTLALGMISFLVWRRYRLRPEKEAFEDSSESFLRMYSYIELKIATRNFRSKLGSGGFGSVFKGSLADGTLVAVKKLDSGSRQHEKQFRAEISSLGNIQHANLIRLRGFCAQGSRRLLVYEYMPNGSLNSVLFTGNSKSKQKALDWRIRFQIALGTARGLVYLHEECRDRIIHADVKPENILLDSDFSPKLADFGLSKLLGRDFSKVLTTTRGTRGYLAPEWISGLPITAKVDVYSFGITLLEIMSGRRSIDFTVQDSSQYYFPAWAATQIFQGKIINIVDEAISAEANIEEVRRVGIVGLLCIEREEEKRPSMEQVVRMLEGKLEPPTLQMPRSELVDKQQADGSTTS